MRSFRPLQRGISLVEALVAMLVMSFGMLAIVGLQATLRLNADVAKQRAEAVRRYRKLQRKRMQREGLLPR